MIKFLLFVLIYLVLGYFLEKFIVHGMSKLDIDNVNIFEMIFYILLIIMVIPYEEIKCIVNLVFIIKEI